MNEEQMAQPDRAPDATKIGKVSLLGYEFYIDKRGYASIRKDDKKSVEGILFEISKEDEEKLDIKEGVKYGTYTKAHLPEVDALCYVGATPEEGVPKDGYLEKIIKAAKANNFPDGYVSELESWFNKKSS